MKRPAHDIEIAYEKLGIYFDQAGNEIEATTTNFGSQTVGIPSETINKTVSVAVPLPAPEVPTPPAPARRMGRPKGSKNKRK